MHKITIFLIGLTLHASLLASDVFWPGWLGPDRDGQVDYFEPPTQWPKDLKKDWSLVVGEGSAMPVVADGRVYQHARQRSDEVVWCVDLETGDVLWRKSYPVKYRIQSPGERHGNGPLSNPTLADGRLFTLSVTGILSVWTADSGKLIWRRDYADRYRKTHPDWGHSTSPLVDGDQVIVHFGSDNAGVLVALDVATGKEVWTEGEDGACHASPIIIELQGVRQIVEWNDESVVGIESQTGRRLWAYHLPHRGSNQNSPTLVHYKG
jgi:outer membrane protein assembly factor BamB